MIRIIFCNLANKLQFVIGLYAAPLLGRSVSLHLFLRKLRQKSKALYSAVRLRLVIPDRYSSRRESKKKVLTSQQIICLNTPKVNGYH